MKKLKILVIWCLVLSLMFSMGMTTVGLAEDAQESGQENGEVKRLHEITELREKSSKTYLLEDGTYQFVGHAEDIHYIDDSGEYVDINNAISSSAKEDYVYSNTANSWYTHFSDSLDQKGAVVMEKDEYSISFSIAMANETNVQKSSVLNKSDSIFDEYLSSDSRTVVYKDVYHNVDIAYTVRTGGLKEDIILRDSSAPNTFEFSIDASGLTLSERDGLTYFVNNKGEDVFRLEPMYMEDANGKFSDKVSYSIEESEGGYRLTVTADEDFLKAQDTVYPVVIDPSVMVCGEGDTYDTYASGRYKDNNYYLYDWLRTGRDDAYWTRRSFIKFDLPIYIAGDTVTDAYLRVKKYSGATPDVDLYRPLQDWESNTLTWNNMPPMAYMSYLSTGSVDSGDWWKMDIGEYLVDNWLEGHINNYGLMFRDAVESGTAQWTTWYSSDAASPNKPELVIEYSSLYSINVVSIKKATDRTFRDEYPSYTTKINDYITTMNDPFAARWNIIFSEDSWRSFTTLPADDCSLAHNVDCNTTYCGSTCVDDTSTPNHHKNHYRNWGLAANGVSTADIQVTFFGFNPCSAAGLAGGDYATIACPDLAYWTDDYNMRTIQHEISHLFGCADHSAGSQPCIMSGGMENDPFGQGDIWCDSCESDFDRDAQ